MSVRYATLEFGLRKICAVLVDEEVTVDLELASFVESLERDPSVKTPSGREAIPYGLDFEWTMDSRLDATKTRGTRPGERKTNNPVSTVQLASSTRALVVHLSGKLGHRMPCSLRRFLLDRRFVPVGCNMASGDDFKLRTWHGLKLHHALDVGKMDAGIHGNDPTYPRGLDKLVEEYVGEGGKRPLPSVAHGFWSVVPLSEELFRYAAVDAYATLAVYREMQKSSSETFSSPSTNQLPLWLGPDPVVRKR
jgi:hypothetical protein